MTRLLAANHSKAQELKARITQTLESTATDNKSDESRKKIALLQELFINTLHKCRSHTPEFKFNAIAHSARGMTYKKILEIMNSNITKRSIEDIFSKFKKNLNTRGMDINKTLFAVLAYIAGFVKLDEILAAAGIQLPTDRTGKKETDIVQVSSETSDLKKTLQDNAEYNQSDSNLDKINPLQGFFASKLASLRTSMLQLNFDTIAACIQGKSDRQIGIIRGTEERAIEMFFRDFRNTLIAGVTVPNRDLLAVLAYIAGFVKLDEILAAAGIQLPTNQESAA